MATAVTPKAAVPFEPILGMAFETGATEWKIAFSPGLGQRPRLRTVPARDMGRLQWEIKRAKERFGLPADARMVSCYEAGRDGFWLHRALVVMGVENQIVDSSSIEVNRRKRRAKSDRLDAGKLVGMLWRWLVGDAHVWRVGAGADARGGGSPAATPRAGELETRPQPGDQSDQVIVVRPGHPA